MTAAMPRADRPDGYLTSAKRVAGWLRPAWLEVDLARVTANVAHIARTVAPARVCAIVKADGYGHGAVQVACAAIEGGASYLGVALAEEGHELRQAGLDVPVLVLSEPPPEAMRMVVEDHLTAAVYTAGGLSALLDAARAERRDSGAGCAPVPVHLKLDSGMHRVGADESTFAELAAAVAGQPELVLEGAFTHLAVADEPGNAYTGEQLRRFDAALAGLEAEGTKPHLLHAANSAGALCHPEARYAMVRPGIAMYGISPGPLVRAHPAVAALQPVLSLKAQVSFAKEVEAGERVSYGLRYELAHRSVVATVPLGYADGVPRRLYEAGGEVLVGGRRCPIAGTVTMDQIMVDCGPGAGVRTGDEVVLIGRQGSEEVTAWEWASRLGTIAYEVTCGLSPRLPRIYV
jgi:alanine racemase